MQQTNKNPYNGGPRASAVLSTRSARGPDDSLDLDLDHGRSSEKSSDKQRRIDRRLTGSGSGAEPGLWIFRKGAERGQPKRGPRLCMMHMPRRRQCQEVIAGGILGGTDDCQTQQEGTEKGQPKRDPRLCAMHLPRRRQTHILLAGGFWLSAANGNYTQVLHSITTNQRDPTDPSDPTNPTKYTDPTERIKNVIEKEKRKREKRRKDKLNNTPNSNNTTSDRTNTSQKDKRKQGVLLNQTVDL
ncbi:hypothetical protein BDR26DRAFT_896875 [Obelidium mucronatum]|nr:hypothetical protein BDR26DRAFT_896875 [Obelidium mucronatum]